MVRAEGAIRSYTGDLAPTLHTMQAGSQSATKSCNGKIRRGMASQLETAARKVLVVSNWSRGVVARAAQECGYITDIARDVSEAVVQLGRQRYRAILADMDGSDVDCLELVLNVRDFDQCVPIAVMATDWNAADIAAIGSQPGLLLVAKSDSVTEVTNDLARLSLLESDHAIASS